MKRMNFDNLIVIARNEMFNSFMTEIARYTPYTRDEETNIFRQFKVETDCEKQLAIKQDILMHNLRGMVAVAARFSRDADTIMDMVANMTEMVYTAIENFNPELGWKFFSYAVHYMVEACREYIWHDAPIPTPRHKYADWCKIRKAERVLEQRNSYTPTSIEIARWCNEHFSMEISPEDVLAIKVGSIDDKVSDSDGEKVSVAEIGELATKFSVKQERHEPFVSLADALASLSLRERAIVVKYYGLESGFETTIESLAEEFGCSEQEIRNIKEKALKSLRKCKAMRVYFATFAE